MTIIDIRPRACKEERVIEREKEKERERERERGRERERAVDASLAKYPKAFEFTINWTRTRCKRARHNSRSMLLGVYLSVWLNV